MQNPRGGGNREAGLRRCVHARRGAQQRQCACGANLGVAAIVDAYVSGLDLLRAWIPPNLGQTGNLNIASYFTDYQQLREVCTG